MNCLMIITAISLSMDTFSLSLIYGTLNISKKNKLFLTFLVGLFHFFLPLFGFIMGKIVLQLMPINPNYLVSIILSFIGIQMIISSFGDDEVNILGLVDYILFAFAVSIDSFSVGITFTFTKSNIFVSSFTFSIFSALFTLIGLFIGNKIGRLTGKLSTFFGGIILIVVGLSYIL